MDLMVIEHCVQASQKEKKKNQRRRRRQDILIKKKKRFKIHWNFMFVRNDSVKLYFMVIFIDTQKKNFMIIIYLPIYILHMHIF